MALRARTRHRKLSLRGKDGVGKSLFCLGANPNANPKSRRLLRIFKYLAVPGSLVSCCKYLLLPLCHGRGREFESRRPRHFFQAARRNSLRPFETQKGHVSRPFCAHFLVLPRVLLGFRWCRFPVHQGGQRRSHPKKVRFMLSESQYLRVKRPPALPLQSRRIFLYRFVE